MMKMHSLTLELNNDNTYVVDIKGTGYCKKCLKKLDNGESEDFCSRDCRREYWAEVNRDLGAFGSY